MKTVLLCITIFLLVTCGNLKPMKNNVKDTIIGNWLLINSQGLSCNVCPEIKFTKDGTGRITKPSKEEYEFRYSLQKDELTFMFEEEKSKENFFSREFEFYYESKQDKELILFVLTSVRSNYTYILSKEKL